MKKRLLSFVLTFSLILGTVPLSVWAEESPADSENVISDNLGNDTLVLSKEYTGEEVVLS